MEELIYKMLFCWLIIYLNHIRKILLYFLLIVYGCSSGSFYLYDKNGKELSDRDKYSDDYINSSRVDFYLNKVDINREYNEINIIATNNYYYGEFFFDEVFMNLLRKKASSLGADGIIFKKDFYEFSEYDEEFLYFTLIEYEDQ